jgi:hypothetical protein
LAPSASERPEQRSGIHPLSASPAGGWKGHTGTGAVCLRIACVCTCKASFLYHRCAAPRVPVFR